MVKKPDWVAQAEGDLDHARSDLGRGYCDRASSPAQQAAEKAVKKVSSSSVRVFYPELSPADIICRLAERLPGLNGKLPLERVVLFGSYARGNYTASNDIDLLVVYRGRRRADAFAAVKRTLGLPRLEPHVYSRTGARRLTGLSDRVAKRGRGFIAPGGPLGSYGAFSGPRIR